LRVIVINLGCAKNLVDSEVMSGLLQQAGYRLVADPAQAEVIIINTCSFITEAKEEAIATILEHARYKETGNCQKLIVAGCLAQRYGRQLTRQMPEIDVLVGTGGVPRIVEVVQRACRDEKPLLFKKPGYKYHESLPRLLSTPPYTAYLKIADGCNNHCSYCIIPQIRGPYQSRPLEVVLGEARQLAERGVKEIILVAQDTTRYGLDLYGEYYLANLLKELVRIDDLYWIRLLYCYPTCFTDELVEVIAREKKVCSYLDIPLQHASAEILKMMHRCGNAGAYWTLIKHLRKMIPRLTLRTTFLVGFPGETEQYFEELLEFVEKVEFDWLGVFTYSREEGTMAARMARQVPEAVKEERYHRVMLLQREITRQKNEALVGQTVKVLVEEPVTDREGYFYGRSERSAPEIDGIIDFYAPGAAPGMFLNVRLTGVEDYDMLGKAF
jgi:ribosomal protein S12 methylthiotransferase